MSSTTSAPSTTAPPTTGQGRGRTPAPGGPKRVRVAVVTLILVAAVLGVVMLSIGLGQFATAPGDVFASIRRVVFNGADPLDNQVDAVLWNIRFPRIALGLLAGAALAVAGAVMQGVFANPLAEPSIIGVNAGASVGATLVLVLGAAVTSPWLLPGAAFLGAIVVTVVVWAFARTGGKAAVLTLVLTGIAINAIASAGTSFLIFLGDTTAREQVIFWQLGTLSNATWEAVGITLVIFTAGFIGCMVIRRPIDVLSLGDASASASGIHVERLRLVAILLACLLTGVAVAFGGIIAFVGLIVPHTIRLMVGPSHRYLVPLSALGGAVLLAAADIATRNLIAFSDLPIGIFTAIVGGPLFLLLLRRTLHGQGGLR
ncbi:iron ABC transporter permease [Nocardioides sp. AE5]|uniref:FecCD family ABC transporter permease n=1 Tax=Nocardioides sp. AE5 TaxID=2962573 RepID=UPI002881EBE4|nr:iron ABC transporter permease [Nocardioides sp. AE5]MDT0201939.1 iron ABC transporter permease [Nocardioides sp. AE5]